MGHSELGGKRSPYLSPKHTTLWQQCWELPFSWGSSLEKQLRDRTLEPSELQQQGRAGPCSVSLLGIGHTEVLPDSSMCAHHLLCWRQHLTKEISAWDSKCCSIWIKNNNDVYQSNEVFRWNALHQCNLLEFSLFYGQTCKPPPKKCDKWCSSCRWSAPWFAMKTSYYLKKLSAMW